MSEDKTLEFLGNRSLENNGGFASVRTKANTLGLEKGDALVARIRGDGREYSINLYVRRPLIAFSYRAMVPRKKNEWIVARVPLDKFAATSFGNVEKDAGPVDPKEVNAFGFIAWAGFWMMPVVLLVSPDGATQSGRARDAPAGSFCVGPPGLRRLGAWYPVPHGTGSGCVGPPGLDDAAAGPPAFRTCNRCRNRSSGRPRLDAAGLPGGGSRSSLLHPAPERVGRGAEGISDTHR